MASRAAPDDGALLSPQANVPIGTLGASQASRAHSKNSSQVGNRARWAADAGVVCHFVGGESFSMRGFVKLGIACTAALAVLCGDRAARAEDWATAGLDGAHARLTAERSGAGFSRGWTVATDGNGAVASPVTADGYVVTVDLEGAVRAQRAEDGAPVWRVALGAPVQGTPAVARGRVFVPTVANKLVALRLADGETLWTHDTGGMTLSSPTPVNMDVIVAAGFPARTVLRLSGATGEQVWQSPAVMEQFSNTPPAVGSGLAVVGSNGGRYYAFDLASGALRWQYAADGIVHLAAPVIAGGRVYMAGGKESDHVHAVDAATGQPVPGWPIDLPAPAADIAGTSVGRQRAVSSFAAAGGLVVLTTRLDDFLDTDANGAADKYLSRELAVAMDPSGAIAWQHDLGRLVTTEQNDVPKYFVCPTPAAYGADGGTLVAAASSLEARVTVLDAASGAERARATLAGAALASPVLANGRLLSVAADGTLEGLLSGTNLAPTTPVLGKTARPLDAGDVTLRWLAARDADGETPSYELRIDDDGEVLSDWQQQIFLGAGVTSTAITATLSPGVTYTYAVRARDGHGALSGWSLPETFTVAERPPVTVGDMPFASLRAALDAAQPGDVIRLGAGRYILTESVRIGAGVAVRGAGPGKTIIDATGLAVGVRFDGTDAEHRSGLSHATVHGAETCLQVASGTTGVALGHLIVLDCQVAGVAIEANGAADVANATLVRDGTALHALGKATIKNSLVARNGVGFAAGPDGTIASSYDNLAENQTDRSGDGLVPGTGDLSEPVTFADLVSGDLRLPAAQGTTDKGDPADAVGEEPAPNGGRINLGAYGGTAEAELSLLSTNDGSGTNGSGAPTVDPVTGKPGTPSPTVDEPASDGGGCAVGGRGRGEGTALLLAGLAALVARRRRRSFK
jgi:MYXO-CTERM domain-containing protein